MSMNNDYIKIENIENAAKHNVNDNIETKSGISLANIIDNLNTITFIVIVAVIIYIIYIGYIEFNRMLDNCKICQALGNTFGVGADAINALLQPCVPQIDCSQKKEKTDCKNQDNCKYDDASKSCAIIGTIKPGEVDGTSCGVNLTIFGSIFAGLAGLYLVGKAAFTKKPTTQADVHAAITGNSATDSKKIILEDTVKQINKDLSDNKNVKLSDAEIKAKAELTAESSGRVLCEKAIDQKQTTPEKKEAFAKETTQQWENAKEKIRNNPDLTEEQKKKLIQDSEGDRPPLYDKDGKPKTKPKAMPK